MHRCQAPHSGYFLDSCQKFRDAFFMQIAHTFFSFYTTTEWGNCLSCSQRYLQNTFHFRVTTPEWSNSLNSSYSITHLQLPCDLFTWPGDVSTPVCNLSTIKLYSTGCLDMDPGKRHTCVALVRRCVCICCSVYEYVCFVGNITLSLKYKIQLSGKKAAADCGLSVPVILRVIPPSNQIHSHLMTSFSFITQNGECLASLKMGSV